MCVYMYIYIYIYIYIYSITPSDGRPPGIYGQFRCALMYFSNKWPLTGGHPQDMASKSVQKNHLLSLTAGQFMWPMY